jgi:hypothetical protein
MIKTWTHDISLAIQAKSGASPALFVWAVIVVLTSLTAFVFLCVALYDWLALQFEGVIAGLASVAIFIVVATIAVMASALVRRRARARAILERAARAHAPSRLLDPKIVAAALQAGRTLGWQRIVPLALLGFMAAQWARERHEHGGDGAS